MGEPKTLQGIDIESDHSWIKVEANVIKYAPGSVVYLVTTSDPIIFASALVSRDGSTEISGFLPLDVLPEGAHNVRVFGTRDLGGVEVDKDGELQISEDTMKEIEKFDPRSNGVVALMGSSASVENGNHWAVRLIPLDGSTPWWSLIVYIVLTLFLMLLSWRFGDLAILRIGYWLALVVGIALPLSLAWLSYSYWMFVPTFLSPLLLFALDRFGRLWFRRKSAERPKEFGISPV